MTELSSAPVAVIFPGQGSQRTGMARDFVERFSVSREAFAEAGDALGLDVAALCFEPDPRLDLTEYTQPAILTAEIAMMRALTRELGMTPGWFGGHSLGEYTALCAAGVIPLPVAVRIVRQRGALMQQAVAAGEGAMSAILAPGIAERDLAAELDAIEVDIANRNSKNQVVISGRAERVEQAEQLLVAMGCEVVRLNVSAPFHSRLMRSIEPAFRAVLSEASARFSPENAGSVTSNFTGKFHEPALPALIDALTRQVSGSVDFVANMHALAGVAERIVEIGPGRPLRGFFQTIGREVTSIVSLKTAERLGA